MCLRPVHKNNTKYKQMEQFDLKLFQTCVNKIYIDIPYRMKIYTEFNLVTWLRLVKFTGLNITEF